MRSKALSLFLVLGFAVFMMPGKGRSQDYLGALSWSVSLPQSDMKDFTNKTSYRGIGLEFRKFNSSQFSIGLSFAWNVFHERTGETLHFESDSLVGDFSGIQDRYINSFPIMAAFHGYLGEEGGIRPYAGLLGGGMIFAQRFELGVGALSKSKWRWAIAPEIGVVIPTSPDVNILISGKYYYSFPTSTLARDNVAQSYFSINVGFAWNQ